MNNLQSVTAFLQSRRSSPPAIMGAPYPSRGEMLDIATMGLRAPDHKKLEPWRLVALERDACVKLSEIVANTVPQYVDMPQKAEKISGLYENAHSVIAMVFSPVENADVPEWEQMLSMGAVGLSLVNGAISLGYGANWLTGFLCECPEVETFLGIQAHESICGMVHFGTTQNAPPERPRPELRKKVTFL